jgi:DNA-binding XRE family transcriptional regulator
MTGNDFKQLMTDNGYSQKTLSERWGVVRQTIASICKSEEVEPLYADAIKAIAFERQAAKLASIVSLFNENNQKG